MIAGIIITVVLVIMLVIGLMLFENYTHETTGFIITLLCILYLMIHFVGVSLCKFEYNKFKIKRDSFERTLTNARLNGNEYETATIVRDVAKWNECLASQQYNNTLFLLDAYYDDRIMDLKPIE